MVYRLILTAITTGLVFATSETPSSDPTVVYAGKSDNIVGCAVDINGYYYNLLPLSLEL